MAESSFKNSISENEFFAGLEPEFVDFLAQHAAIRRLKKNEVLFRYGEPANHFYLVFSGEISLEVAAIEGPTLVLQDLGSGAILGWSWLISPYKWTFQARAKSSSELLEFDGSAVLAHCEQDPRFGYDLLKRFSALMSERLHFARQQMMKEWRPPGFA
ncbi:MAG: cyclic nucleotide-binding domain-containing protein [Burkholderiales bacterium]|nr:cyclic nucleotide-binding domain-containing protein [Burkholderiales bacterium]